MKQYKWYSERTNITYMNEYRDDKHLDYIKKRIEAKDEFNYKKSLSKEDFINYVKKPEIKLICPYCNTGKTPIIKVYYVGFLLGSRIIGKNICNNCGNEFTDYDLTARLELENHNNKFFLLNKLASYKHITKEEVDDRIKRRDYEF